MLGFKLCGTEFILMRYRGVASVGVEVEPEMYKVRVPKLTSIDVDGL